MSDLARGYKSWYDRVGLDAFTFYEKRHEFPSWLHSPGSSPGMWPMLRGVRILDEVMGVAFICVDLHWSTGKENLWMFALYLHWFGARFFYF